MSAVFHLVCIMKSSMWIIVCKREREGLVIGTTYVWSCLKGVGAERE